MALANDPKIVVGSRKKPNFEKIARTTHDALEPHNDLFRIG
jgi:hypothetical protein